MTSTDVPRFSFLTAVCAGLACCGCVGSPGTEWASAPEPYHAAAVVDQKFLQALAELTERVRGSLPTG